MSEHFHTDFQAGSPVPSLGGLMRGTLIETPHGPRRIETIMLGDAVTTLDDGAQIVQSASRQHVRVAAIRIAAHVCGNTETLVVAPQQRVLISGWQAELYHGAEETLVEAWTLLNGTSVRLEKAPVIELINLGFDSAQIIIAHGAPVESDLPHHAFDFERAVGPRGWQVNAVL